MNAVAPTDPDGHSAVYQEAAVELGKGIALGLVPFLGQAIDAYDTIESTLMLYNAKKPEDKESAQFDLVLALVGWVPGPGDGVRKTFRLVNKDPQRFAPVLFDLLRFVLQECGIQTSPEALLDELFNAGKLTAVLNEAKKGVEDATAFKSLPHWLQTVVLTALSQAAANLPMMLGIVEKRLKKWKKVQHNSSANVQSTGKAKQHLPDAKDGSTAQEGKNRAGHARTDSANNSQLAILDPSQLANELIGISGEHIADYMCLQKFGCGSGWGKHDDGGTGKWTKGNPDKDTPGKLSKKGKLYQLADGANGTGIDSVWHASGNNQGKPYAIVEAKASRLEDAPKFHRKKDWKPKINSKLGDNRRSMKEKIKSKLADDIIKDPSELLEPLEDDKVGAAPKKGGGKAGGKTGGKSGGAATTRTQQSTKSQAPQTQDKGYTPGTKAILVQMSHEWIRKNSLNSVGISMTAEVLKKLPADKKNYSRHLFFSPYYHESGSPKDHMLAKHQNTPPSTHEKHEAFHYDEGEVLIAVNKRKKSLRKEFDNLLNLKEEQ